MIFEMIRSHLPRSWQAAVALLVLISAIGMAFNALTQILVQPSAGAWLKFLGGLALALPAAVYFYRRQITDTHPKTVEQLEVERLAEEGRRLNERQRPVMMTAYHLNDSPDVDAKKVG